MASRRSKVAFIVLLAGAGGIGFFGYSTLQVGSLPAGVTKEGYVKIARTSKLDDALALADKELGLTNKDAIVRYTTLKRISSSVGAGTYALRPGMSGDDVLKALRSPISKNVRIPEGWWIARVAARLENEGICKAADYIALTEQPAKFQSSVKFPLPKTGSLEGYLFPDTYRFEPEAAAETVIKKQLKTFESKVFTKLAKPQLLWRTVRIGSLIELEVGRDQERTVVSGIIANRLAKQMPLEIDATVLYALQEWTQLKPGVVRKVKSPYNTYLNKGLPPGPIGSPGMKSLLAAERPQAHPYFFYVAMPDGSHRFARTYTEHRDNINKRRRLLAMEARRAPATKSGGNF